VSITDI